MNKEARALSGRTPLASSVGAVLKEEGTYPKTDDTISGSEVGYTLTEVVRDIDNLQKDSIAHLIQTRSKLYGQFDINRHDLPDNEEDIHSMEEWFKRLHKQAMFIRGILAEVEGRL